MKTIRQTLIASMLIITLAVFSLPQLVNAASAQEINIGVNSTLKRFKREITGGSDYLNKAAGVLVFSKVYKAGIGIGGEYGEGALRIGGKTVAYYSTAAASVGFQLGAQMKSIVIVFLKQSALNKFRNSDGWKAGVDGSVAIVEWGVGEDINSMDINDPVVGFVFNNKGLMYNLTLEGSKFTKIDR